MVLTSQTNKTLKIMTSKFNYEVKVSNKKNCITITQIENIY